MISKTIYQNLSFKVLKELSWSCNVQSFEIDKCRFFHSLTFIYFLKRAIGDKSLIKLFFFSFVNKNEMRRGYRRSGGHVFFAKYILNLPYIFIKKILFSYIIFVKRGLTMKEPPKYAPDISASKLI